MDTSLLDLLRGGNNDESKDYSHTTLYGPHKNWTINDSSYENFWKKYCELAQNPETNKKKLCLAEIPRKHMPIIADLTLKFHPLDGITEDPYDIDFILSIVFCYQQIIKETLKISETGTELICCVMKTETVAEDDLIICRIRLQFPYCKTVGQIQNRLIRPLVLQMFRTTNVIARLRSQPVNEWEDIVDPLSVENPIVMYGSSSSPNTPKYFLDNIFPQVDEKEIDGSKTRILETAETFFPQNHEHSLNGIVSMKMFTEDNDDEEDGIDHDFWLPYFLSIFYLKEITLPKNSLPVASVSSGSLSKSVKGKAKGNGKGNASYSEEDQDSPEYLSTVFLSMLNRKRAEEKHFWLDVGKALYTAFEGNPRGLEKWIDFTETSDQHSAEDCKNVYYNFTDSKLTVKTLAFYAREDNPIEYKKWHEVWYYPSIEKAMSLTHSDVAEAVYRVYWLEFACSNLAKNNLYYFKANLWKKLDSGHVLKSMISNEFINIIEKFRIDVAMQIQDSNDKNFKDSAEIMIQKICKLIGKLKNRTFKSSIFAECSEKFYIDNFENILDSNCDLMGCVNCIIECLDKKAVARTGKPEDFVSRTTGVHWRFDYNEKHPAVQKVLGYLSKVFPDKDLLDYFGKLMAATLKGKNSDKIFPIHTGKGNNSKSMIKKLVEAAFGDYVITIPTSVFTGAKSGGGPDPAVARSKFAHVAFVQEPDSDVPLKSGTIKEFSGGDRFFSRMLNENGGEISPMFTLNLMCNVIPIMMDSGDAMKNRIRVLPYLSTWVRNAPKNPDDQFKERKFQLDPFFERQIPEMASAFLWWLVKIMYARYKIEKAYEPALIQKYTEGYWEENDIYGQFIKENLEKAYKFVPDDYKGEKPIDDKACITLAEMYGRFKEWFKENYQLKLPDRQLLRNEIENRVTKCVQRNFYGVKFKVLVADI